MTDPEIKPLPWYRALVTRTPRGRKLRWRLFVALLALFWSLGWDPRQTLARFGLWHWHWDEPPHLTPAEKTELARRETERYYRKEGCEHAGTDTWICPNPDAGISVADCREILKATGYDLDGDAPREMKCGRPQNWPWNKEKKDATQAPK